MRPNYGNCPVTVMSVGLEKKIFEALTVLSNISWPLNFLKKDSHTKLTRKCQVIKWCISCSVLLSVITLISTFPCFGSQRDFFLYVEVFEEYFGEWSFIPYYFYFAASPFLCYHFLRVTFVFVYAFLHVQLQYLLIEEFLFETYRTDDLKGWRYLQDIRYQQKIGRSLRLCITHHVALKMFVKKTVDLVMMAMPFFLVLGVLLLISVFTFIINFAVTMSIISKIRILLFAATGVCITMTFCWSGQQLINVTDEIFWVLARAPFYFWNRENSVILLTLLTNCTNNDSVVLAGICLDYKLFLSVVKLAVSYSLVLFKLRKSSLV
nr:PREDICTED: uncharacterized protein LOC107397675 [Tribolium castaneum]|eukprot:XP_015834086.1 PREDICTED: uncharacterized protein LOC107397675 [Tribolium castaneum]